MKTQRELQQLIIEAISRNGQMTRPELMALLSIRPASIIEAVDVLIKSGTLVEPDRAGKKTGRRAPKLAFNPNHLWIAGIDFQFRKTLGVICNMTGEIIFKVETEAGLRNSSETARIEIRAIIERLREMAGGDWPKVRGICLSDPGLVDLNTGVSLKAVNVPAWENVSSRAWLEQICKMPALVLPKTMALTYMEYLTRHLDTSAGMLLLNTGGGIGAGLIKNGELFVGNTGRGMEIGHLVMMPQGPLCRCGNRGCLEALAGEAGIRRRVEEVLSNNVETVLRNEPFSLDYFIRSAGHDRAAGIIASEICDYLAQGLTIAATLLNPSHIIIAGELTALGQPLIDTIARSLRLNCVLGTADHLKLELSTLGGDDTIRGAVMFMRRQLLEKELQP